MVARATTADALSTAFSLMPIETAWRALKATHGDEAWFVDHHGETTRIQALKVRVRPRRAPSPTVGRPGLSRRSVWGLLISVNQICPAQSATARPDPSRTKPLRRVRSSSQRRSDMHSRPATTALRTGRQSRRREVLADRSTIRSRGCLGKRDRRPTKEADYSPPQEAALARPAAATLRRFCERRSRCDVWLSASCS